MTQLLCTNCQSQLSSDFGVVTCNSCGTTYLVDFDGQLIVNQDLGSASDITANPEENPDSLDYQNHIDLKNFDGDNESIENLISDEWPVDLQNNVPNTVEPLVEEFDLNPVGEEWMDPIPLEMQNEIDEMPIENALPQNSEYLTQQGSDINVDGTPLESTVEIQDEMRDQEHTEENTEDNIDGNVQGDILLDNQEDVEENLVENIKVTWSEPLPEEMTEPTENIPKGPSPLSMKPATTAAKFSAPPTFGEKKINKKFQESTTESIMREVVAFGNSSKSNANSGWYLYNLTIRGMDSQDIKTRVLQTISDPRIKLNPKSLYNSIQAGSVTINELNPLKVFVLVNALKSLPIEIYWEQHELTE